MAKVVEISIKNKITKKRELMDSYFFAEGKVSLYAQEVRSDVSRRAVRGICMKRFKGDIVTSGLDYTQVEEMDIIHIGGLEIEVTQVGKPCHSLHCIAYRQHEDCIMQSGVIFGEVKKAGRVLNGVEFN